MDDLVPAATSPCSLVFQKSSWLLRNTTIVNLDSCAVIGSSCLVKTTESNYFARSYQILQ
jgi:hypothetical protein